MTASTSTMTTAKSSTEQALNPDPLVSEHVRLWPYAPGVFGLRDTLYRVWKLMEDDGATHLAFWDETGSPTSGDLASFIRAFDGIPGKLLILVERTDTNQLCGAIWLTNFVYGHQAFTSMWMQKDARGALALEAGKLCVPALFRIFNLQQLWAVTPWLNAGAFVRRLGYQRWVLLPGYCHWDGKPKDVWLYRLTRDRIIP